MNRFDVNFVSNVIPFSDHRRQRSEKRIHIRSHSAQIGRWRPQKPADFFIYFAIPKMKDFFNRQKKIKNFRPNNIPGNTKLKAEKKNVIILLVANLLYPSMKLTEVFFWDN